MPAGADGHTRLCMIKTNARIGAAAIAANLLLWSPVAAQDGEAKEESNAPIVVTGKALAEPPSSAAYATRVIERDALIATPSGRLEEALADVAGFQQFRRSDSRSANPSAQGATLRALGGNATSRALVLLDGVPMADPFFGFIPFNAIAPERLAAATITRGGGSGPFGAGALAGTIDLTSAGLDDLGSLGGHLYANDRSETESALYAAGRLGQGFGVISGRWDRGKGFFTTPAADRVEASARAGYDAFSVQARGVVPAGPAIELQARGLIYDDRRTLRFEGADSSSTGQDASLRLVGRGPWQFDALAYLQARNFTNIVISSTRFVPVLDQRNTPSTGLGGKLELRPPVGSDGVLRLGGDVRRSEGELYETALNAFTGAVRERRNAGGVTSDVGLFAEYDHLLGPARLTAGVRADRYVITDGFSTVRDAQGSVTEAVRYEGRSGWQVSFRGGALMALGGGFDVRAAAYRGLRLPTLNELYRPFVVFPVTTLANADLRNERLEGLELGIDYAPAEPFTISLTVFDNRVRDAVANVTLDAVTRQRRNIEALEARGIEADSRLTFGRLQVSASLAYTDARVREPGAAFDGNRPSQSPVWAGSATLSHALGSEGRIALVLRHVGDQFEDDLETDILPAVTTLGAYAEVPLSPSLSFMMRAENLTDEAIVTRNQGGSIDLGVPRTIWAGARLTL